jgi:hypothetical protein
MVTETPIKRRFQRSARLHAAASSGSVGHTRPARVTAQNDSPINVAEAKNTQALY